MITFVYKNKFSGLIRAILAIAINVICMAEIIKRSIKLGKNPYANEVFGDTKDFQLAMERAE
jgi:hypothetical protein